MKLIVGLGNPGLTYRMTRHNLGFMVADRLNKHFRSRFVIDKRGNCLKTKVCLKGESLIICKPLAYMNLSGNAVARLASRNKIMPQDMLVVCDDINLELGRIRIKASGSAGGHKGLVSVIGALDSQEFPRLRIGIANPRNKSGLSDYVLSRFSSSEKKIISESLEKAEEAVLCWVEDGVQEAMNRFN